MSLHSLNNHPPLSSSSICRMSIEMGHTRRSGGKRTGLWLLVLNPALEWPCDLEHTPLLFCQMMEMTLVVFKVPPAPSLRESVYL